MQKIQLLSLLMLLAAFSIGCPANTVGDDPDPILDNANVSDAGVSGENNGEPTFTAMGEACESNDDCEFGDCLNVFGQYGFKGYHCSMRCSDDNECATNGGSHAVWSCQNLGQLGSHCMMECDNETCPEDYICLRDIQLAEPTDLCQSLGQQCDNGTCPEGQYCTITTTGYEFASYCTDEPVGTIAGGETCNPNMEMGMPCVTNDDCPSDYTALSKKSSLTEPVSQTLTCAVLPLFAGRMAAVQAPVKQMQTAPRAIPVKDLNSASTVLVIRLTTMEWLPLNCAGRQRPLALPAAPMPIVPVRSLPNGPRSRWCG